MRLDKVPRSVRHSVPWHGLSDPKGPSAILACVRFLPLFSSRNLYRGVVHKKRLLNGAYKTEGPLHV